MTLPRVNAPQKVPYDIGIGEAKLQQLAPILFSIVQDLNVLKTAINSHTHPENSAATYTQSANTGVSAYTVNLNTVTKNSQQI